MGDLIMGLFDFILHIDQHLEELIINYEYMIHLVYLFLFLIIFCETGLVVTPFLPGDSLLFAAGALAIPGKPLNIFLLWIIIVTAAILGDTVNYYIGKLLGNRIKGRFIKRRHIEKTEAFFEKHGGKTIIIARFVPIVRTFAPFVAGVGHMRYSYFISYNVVGGLLWVSLFLLAGRFFGNLPFIRDNFSLVIIAIILISLLPAIITWINGRRVKR